MKPPTIHEQKDYLEKHLDNSVSKEDLIELICNDSHTITELRRVI